MTETRASSLGIDMPFGEAVERLIGAKPSEPSDNVKLKKTPAEARARC